MIEISVNGELKQIKESRKTTSSGSISWISATRAKMEKGFDEMLGSGVGIVRNQGIDPSMYMRNAMYGEMSSGLATHAKLQTLGGAEKAAQLDAALAVNKAASQKGAILGEVEANAKAAGMSPASAANLAKDIASGAASFKSIITSGAAEAAAKLANTSSFSKTLSENSSIAAMGGKYNFASQNEGMAVNKVLNDQVAIKSHGGINQFISDKMSDTLFKETASAKQAQIYDNQDMMNKRIAGVFEHKTSKERNELAQKMIKQGLLEEGSTGDDYTATTGTKARKAWATAGAGAMNRDTTVMIGDERMNLSQDMTTGNTLANIDSSTSERAGHQFDTNAEWRLAQTRYPGDINKQKQFVSMQQYNHENWKTKGTSLLAAGQIKAMEMMGIEDTPENRGMFEEAALAVGGTAAAVLGNMGIKKVSGKGVVDHFTSATNKFRGVGDKTFDNSNNSHHSKSSKERHQESFHNNTPSSDLNMHNYSTIDEVTQAKEKLHAMEPEAAARKAVKQSLSEAGKQYPKNLPQRTEIAQMQQDLRNGRPVDAQRFSELTGKEAPAGRGGAINMKALGEEVKVADHNRLNAAAHSIKHPTSEAKAWYKKMWESFTHTKTGRTAGVAAAMVGAGAMLMPSDAEAGNMRPVIMPEGVSEAAGGMSMMDAAVTMGTATAVNGVTAAFGVKEMKQASMGVAEKALKEGIFK